MTTRNKINIYQGELGYQKQNQNDDEKFCGSVSLFVPVVDVGIVVVLRLLSIAPRQQLPILLLRLQQIFLYFFVTPRINRSLDWNKYV